jgi:hypothetical protein
MYDRVEIVSDKLGVSSVGLDRVRTLIGNLPVLHALAVQS